MIRIRDAAAALTLTGGLILTSAADSQEVWSGLTYSFSKASFADPTLPANQDPITPSVALTRAASAGLFNAAQEMSYIFGSPADTEWATGLNNPFETVAATNWAALTFDNWQNAYGGPGVLANEITIQNAVVHLITDDIYLDLRFTDWGLTPQTGGRFAYLRAEAPAVPEPASIALLAVGLFVLGLSNRCRRFDT